MDRKEFAVKVQSKKHIFDITNTNGSKEAWRWLKKNKWCNLPPITEAQFGAIIKAMNQMYANDFLKGKDIVLPHNMGKIELRKRKTSANIVDGKLKVDTPIDWQKTIDLWFEDEESEKKKKLVRRNIGEVYIVHYNKSTAKFNNKMFYKFLPARTLKQSLKNLINQGSIDAFLFRR